MLSLTQTQFQTQWIKYLKIKQKTPITTMRRNYSRKRL